ncbi:MAG: flavin reductase family protein [Propionibacteriaceae bacterium]
MTIHSEHPFLPPDGERNPTRQLRGRLPLPVSVWTAELDGRRVGWTVSSLLVADGEPAEVVGLVDEDSELADTIVQTRTVAISLLGGTHRTLADAFAGVAPAPGGAFRFGAWTATPWGPVLDDAVGWVGARLVAGDIGHAGWGLLVRATVERVELGSTSDGALAYLRGRYRQLEL